MSDKPKVSNPTYTLPSVSTTSTLDLLEKIVALYSTYRVLAGQASNTLKPQLVTVLAIYILRGFNKEAKREATAVLKLKDDTRINGLNKELRDAGYIIRDKGNEHISHLNEDLKALGENFPILERCGFDQNVNRHRY